MDPVLRRLLAGRSTLTPRERPQGRFYEITAAGCHPRNIPGKCCSECGAPGVNRTPGPGFRKPAGGIPPRHSPSRSGTLFTCIHTGANAMMGTSV